jgi:hypothetical protein
MVGSKKIHLKLKIMIKRISTLLATFGLALSFGLNANAQTSQMVYTYHHAGESTTTWGTSKHENYDVAIHINDASLVGSTITGIRVPLPDNVSGLESKGAVFLTKTLSVKSTVNVADVEVDSFDVSAGIIEVNFKQPYTITSDGIYVGYSLKTSTNFDKTPLVVVSKSEADGFWIHTSRTYRKYTDKSSTLGVVSAMEVFINTNVTDAATATLTDQYAQIGAKPTLNATIINKGCNGVQSVDYTLNFQGQTITRHADLTTAIPGYFNSTATLPVELPTVEGAGQKTVSLTIDKVNGVDNLAANKEATATLTAIAFVPTKRPLVEEYTGTWCGWCPRGFVGMENLYATYGDDFCGVAYHNGDPMATISSSSYPSNVPGFPDAWIDRTHETDAYCGDNYDGHYHANETYEQFKQLFGVADISVKASQDGNTITATATTKFPATMELNDRYQLGFILTANGFTGEGSDWQQSNYYPSYASSYPDADMNTFTQGSSYVSGLTYNFVILERSGKQGISNSLPATVNESEENTYTYTFDLSKVSSIIADQNLTYDVIAILLDTQDDNSCVNAAKGHVESATGISNVNADAKKATAQSYYSLDGKQLTAPVKGLNIVKMSDGSVKKMIVK